MPSAHERLLGFLARTDVAEVAMVSGRLPCAKVGAAFKPIDAATMDADAILQVLFHAGGSRYVDALGEKPTQWTFRLDLVGVVAVAAVQRAGQLQARFAVTKRDAQPNAPVPDFPKPRTQTATGLADAAAAATRAAEPPPSTGYARTLPSATSPSAPEKGGGALELELDMEPRRAPPIPEPPPRLDGRLDEGPALELDMDRSKPALGFSSPNPGAPPTSAPGLAAAPAAAPPVREGGEASLAYALDFNAGMPGMRRSSGAIKAVQEEVFDGSLDPILTAARRANASDLHIVAERPVLFRLAGELVPRGKPLTADVVENTVLGMVPARARGPLDAEGSTDFALAHPKLGRFRVNVTRQRTGYKASVRLIPDELPTLESLGLPAAIAKATHHHQGLIVLTGPTGHGKTSTLAALVNLINSETTHHIITVEDPIEYLHPRKRAMMSQREVGTHTRSFRAALKGSLREDPDVIVIGELRDTETVRIALAASETGHLVIGTMNTPSAAKTIDRLIDLFPPADQAQVRMTLAGGLKLIVSQRLVPNTNKTGVVAAAEVLPGSVALWNLIRDNKTFQIPSLQQRGKGLGILRMDDQLADLVRANKTTIALATPFAESPEDFAAKASAPADAPGAQLPGTTNPAAPKTAGGAAAAAPPAKGILNKAGGLFGGGAKKGS